MCGIVGVFAFKDSNEDKKQAKKREAMLYLFTELLQITQIRGKDATGTSVLFNDGHFLIQKGGVPANEFIAGFGDEKHNYKTFMDNCRKYKEPIKLLVGHCRKSSVGTNFNNNNNHPVRAGEIIGVHNGTLTNHEKVFKKLGCKRDGTVDSEAIMRLIEFYTHGCKDPFTIPLLTAVACRLDGAFSVIAYNANNPFQVALMKKVRPMELVLIKSLQLLVVVSERPFIDDVIFNFNKNALLFNSGFEPIKATDVEVLTFPFDNVGIVDLTKSITPETKIVDLIERHDTFKDTKYWQSTTYASTTYYPNNTYGRTTTYGDKTSKKNDTTPGTSADKGATNTTKATGVGTKDVKTANKGVGLKCKVFNKELNRYVDSDKADSLSEVPAVLLTSNSDAIKLLKHSSIADSETSGNVLKETTSLHVKESFASVPIIIESAGTPVTSPVVQEPINAVLVSDAQETEECTDLFKAAKAAASGAIRFSTEEEVVDYLHAQSLGTLKVLPINALANRLGHSLYERAFLEGAQFCKEFRSSTSAEKVIRITKHVVRLFGNVLDKVCTHKGTYCNSLSGTLQENKYSELTKENIMDVFSKGDLVNNPGMVELVKIIKARDNGKKNSSATISEDGQQ